MKHSLKFKDFKEAYDDQLQLTWGFTFWEALVITYIPLNFEMECKQTTMLDLVKTLKSRFKNLSNCPLKCVSLYCWENSQRFNDQLF